jgi:phospholipase A1/A2
MRRQFCFANQKPFNAFNPLSCIAGCVAIIAAQTCAAKDAFTPEQMRSCLERSVLTADKNMTVKKLEEACALLLNNQAAEPAGESETSEALAAPGVRLLNDRLTLESLNRSNRFVLTPHKRNYLLPFSYTNNPNTESYNAAETSDASNLAFRDVKHAEFEFQLSVKILLRENILGDNGHLFFGYTNHSLWQVYNRKTSAPFRETNHQPELILTFNNDFDIFGFRNVLNEVSLTHQSNGQSGTLSRSWNRIMFNSVFEGEHVGFAFSPWYRLPEDKPRYPGDPDGDDNPDISHYMGNFQFTGAYRHKSDIFSIDLRNNLKSDNRGAIELGWTFPLTSTMRGFVSYFDGYGHSLIDYNIKQQVIGVGITFTDLF